MNRLYSFIAVFVLVCSALPAFQAPTIDKLSDGSSEGLINFQNPGSGTLNITIPKNAYIINATANLTGLPLNSDYPLAPTLDLGNDGKVDWEFNGLGYGRFGYQYMFENGSDEAKFVYQNPGYKNSSIKLSKKVEATSASLNLTPYPILDSKTEKVKIGPGEGNFSIDVPPNAVPENISIGWSWVNKYVSKEDINVTASGEGLGPEIHWNKVSNTYVKVAQTFVPTKKGNLTKVEAFTKLINYPPLSSTGNLTLEITNVNASYNPTGTPLASVSVLPAQVKQDGWTSFVFQNPPNLDANKVYAMVFSAPDSPDVPSAYIIYLNSSNSYNVPNSYRQFTTNGGADWTIAPNEDILFRTTITGWYPFESGDYIVIGHNGIDKILGPGGKANWSGQEGNFQNGLFNGSIGNPGGNPIEGEIIVIINYKLYPLSPKLKIEYGGLEKIIWEKTGLFTQQTRIPDFSNELNNFLRTHIPNLDNLIIDINFNLTSSSSGIIEISNISIVYKNLYIGFKDELNAYAREDEIFAFTFHSNSPGKLLLSDIKIDYTLPPVITSKPKLFATRDKEYVYEVKAYDPEGESVKYSLVSMPEGMNINSDGKITWFPKKEDLGEHQIDVKVEDICGAWTNQTYVLTVRDNRSPKITSEPPTKAIVNTKYIYEVVAIDEDNDSLTYSLTTLPNGMKINSSSGIVTWVPKEIGEFEVVVQVSDEFGGTAIQKYRINVSLPNKAPVITSVPITKAYVGHLYLYKVNGTDEDKDKLNYSIFSSVKEISISSEGEVKWLPTAEGIYNVKVVVSDGKDTVEQSYNITVKKNKIPKFESIPVTNARVGKEYKYEVAATDEDMQTLTYKFDKFPEGMKFEKGIIKWVPKDSQKGKNKVIVNVTDGLDYALQEYDVFVTGKEEKMEFDWLSILIIIIIILAIVATGTYVYKVKKK
ncbi:MAG: putative Ig domain-containing protein [Candidatus Thermoplasmatota archaeon]